MKQTDNVVSFEDAKQDSIARRILLRKLQPNLKELTIKHMKNVMQGMFDNADDALFKMAENAHEENDKKLYFDSMRIVRLQRKSIENIIFENIDACFEQYEKENNTVPEVGLSNELIQEYGALELMEDSDLEIQLAIENLIHKINSAYGPDLSAIEKRLKYLHGQDEFDPGIIPFSAKSIVRSYAKATEMIDLALEVQIIMLKLFDLHCIHNLAGLYNSINQLFIAENVLPVIKHGIVKQDSSQVPAGQEANQHSHAASTNYLPNTPAYPSGQLTSPLWGELQQMLNMQRQSGFVAASGQQSLSPRTDGLNAGSAGAGPVGRSGQTVTPMTSQDVLTSLSEIQSLAIDQLPQGGAHAVGNFLRVHLESVAAQGDQEKVLSPIDNDLIDIVCLVFEYILDDPHLPVVAKASIGRLQIPMLKVAMLDKDFFSMKGHPARYLLNLLASTAVGIDDVDAHNHPVLDKINHVVEYIIENFTDDLSLFEEQTEELNRFITEHNKLEKEACDDLGEQQHEKEELALARAWVKETLKQHLAGRELVKPVADIILGPWKDVMLETYLQEGEHSELWKTQIRFIDVLCWSVEPKKLKLDKNKLGSIIQQLIKTLREGLDRIKYPQEETARIFNILEPYHLASIHGLNLADCALSSQKKESMSDVLHGPANEQDLDNQIEQIISQEKIILEDIVLEDWEPHHDIEQINDEYLTLARHMEMGKWVEFTNESGQTRRAKLAWKSDLLGEYTFLNWKFDVVADKTLLELAEDLRQGHARVVEEVPLMDRALSSVVSSLIPKAR